MVRATVFRQWMIESGGFWKLNHRKRKHKFKVSLAIVVYFSPGLFVHRLDCPGKEGICQPTASGLVAMEPISPWQYL